MDGPNKVWQVAVNAAQDDEGLHHALTRFFRVALNAI